MQQFTHTHIHPIATRRPPGRYCFACGKRSGHPTSYILAISVADDGKLELLGYIHKRCADDPINWDEKLLPS